MVGLYICEYGRFLVIRCSLPPPPKFEGVLEPNERLMAAYRLLENQVRGPESIIVDQGQVQGHSRSKVRFSVCVCGVSFGMDDVTRRV